MALTTPFGSAPGPAHALSIASSLAPFSKSFLTAACRPQRAASTSGVYPWCAEGRLGRGGGASGGRRGRRRSEECVRTLLSSASI
eukprot:scaffold162933_cov25-Tisochrysis_lutea.AAC.2